MPLAGRLDPRTSAKTPPKLPPNAGMILRTEWVRMRGSAPFHREGSPMAIGDHVQVDRSAYMKGKQVQRVLGCSYGTLQKLVRARMLGVFQMPGFPPRFITEDVRRLC